MVRHEGGILLLGVHALLVPVLVWRLALLAVRVPPRSIRGRDPLAVDSQKAILMYIPHTCNKIVR